jgi:hypothetical protein
MLSFGTTAALHHAHPISTQNRSPRAMSVSSSNLHRKNHHRLIEANKPNSELLLNHMIPCIASVTCKTSVRIRRERKTLSIYSHIRNLICSSLLSLSIGADSSDCNATRPGRPTPSSAMITNMARRVFIYHQFNTSGRIKSTQAKQTS